MFEPRPKEPDYAWIPAAEHPEKNRYGKNIETVGKDDELRGVSLNINGDSGISENPDRYKQHGFYFNADRCISCHACEAACSEKNDLPAHLAFRSVGYVEGGTYPAYTRLNISMACNHCDDPVCLKGCPTRAYTKFAEYGAVLQDPDICFGCGYCTWVCPYNAPQLDPIKGEVSKCNMCVDRLEVGLKPACSSACLAGALDFGIIETTPENRDQLETKIPGFPSPEITKPNIRFQQTNSLPREMKRTDSMPLRYERDEQGRDGDFKVKVDDDGRPRTWNLKKLRTREDPLVIFTLVTQAVVGVFLGLFLGPMFGIMVLTPESHPLAWPLLVFSLIGAQTLALVLSTMHLGKPHRFYRAFNNLRYSPVSREVAGVALFYNSLGAYGVFAGLPSLFTWLPEGWLPVLIEMAGWSAVVTGPAALYFMHKIYRIEARPFWNHWQVLTSFFGNMFSLGAFVLILMSLFVGIGAAQGMSQVVSTLAIVVFIGLAMEAIGLYFHADYLNKKGGEAAASQFIQTRDFGKTYIARNIGLIMSLVAVLVLAYAAPVGLIANLLWVCVAVAFTITTYVGRSLFYALVVPTTMPGAFFWKNAGFAEHARETGLADMPQVGVVPDCH